MITIKFKTMDQVLIMYNYLESHEFKTQHQYLDYMINSILEDISLKLFNKYRKDSKRPMKLKTYEVLALVTFYKQAPTKTDPNTAATLYGIFHPLDQQIK